MVWHQIIKTRLWNSEVFGSSSGTEQRHRESMRLWRDGYLAALTPRNYKQTLTLTDGGKLLVFFFFSGLDLHSLMVEHLIFLEALLSV